MRNDESSHLLPQPRPSFPRAITSYPLASTLLHLLAYINEATNDEARGGLLGTPLGLAKLCRAVPLGGGEGTPIPSAKTACRGTNIHHLPCRGIFELCRAVVGGWDGGVTPNPKIPPHVTNLSDARASDY